MIYIYGGGGRAKLIRELLIRLKTRSKDIIFIDDYKKKYNSTSYLLKNFKVDYTFLNIVNNENMVSRLKIRKSLNRYDKFSSKFYQKVQRGFLKLANMNKKKYKIINSNLDILDNQNLVIQTLKKLI